jgi:hypothetical protein
MENQETKKSKEITPEDAYKKYMKSKEYQKNYQKKYLDEHPELREKNKEYQKEYAKTEKFKESRRKYQRERYHKMKEKTEVTFKFINFPDKDKRDFFIEKLINLCNESNVQFEQLGRKNMEKSVEIVV